MSSLITQIRNEIGKKAGYPDSFARFRQAIDGFEADGDRLEPICRQVFAPAVDVNLSRVAENENSYFGFRIVHIGDEFRRLKSSCQRNVR